MNRYLFVAFAALFLAACNHGGGIGMEYDADPNVSASDEAFDSLEIDRLVGYDADRSTESVITVSADRYIRVDVFGQQIDLGTVTAWEVCSSEAEITEEDYQGIVELVATADLMNYLPPAEGDEGCEPMSDGDEGMSIRYVRTDGTENLFSTYGCAPEEAIAAIEDAVNAVAAEYAADCTLADAEFPTDATEEEEGTEESEEEL